MANEPKLLTTMEGQRVSISPITTTESSKKPNPHRLGFLLSGPYLVQIFGQVASKTQAKPREKRDEDMGGC